MSSLKNFIQLTTPLFLLHCVQLGIFIRDLALLTIGMVNDMYAESGNNDAKYATLATQEDFDRFSCFITVFSLLHFQEFL
jgi:hypothetical protein